LKSKKGHQNLPLENIIDVRSAVALEHICAISGFAVSVLEIWLPKEKSRVLKRQVGREEKE